MGSDLKIWVSDKLIVGYSQSTLVQYIISLSKKAKSPVDIPDALKDDLKGSAAGELQAFARELFAKVERRTAGTNAYQQQEREAAMLVKKQRMYTILEDDEDANGFTGGISNSLVSESKTKDSKKKRFREKTEIQDDEVVLPEKEERRVRRRTTQDEDDSDSEEERLRDQREREELEQHMRERDAAGTRTKRQSGDLKLWSKMTWRL